MKEKSNSSEEIKNKDNNFTNDISYQKYRNEQIQNEIKMSNAYLRNTNSQEEKITDNLLKISCLICLILISLSVLVTFLGKNMVKLKARDDNFFMGFSFIGIRTKDQSNLTNDYSIFCLNKKCSFGQSCQLDLELLKEEFDISCRDLLEFRNAGIIVTINLNKVDSILFHLG
jgi:hypothetical protein